MQPLLTICLSPEHIILHNSMNTKHPTSYFADDCDIFLFFEVQ
jgi:hypothetical protein